MNAFFLLECNVYSKEGGQQEPLAVSFRFNVAPSPSMKTCIFKPNPVDQGQEDLRAVSLGGVFQGNYQHVIKNDRASLVREAGVHSIMLIAWCFHVLNFVRWISAVPQRKCNA